MIKRFGLYKCLPVGRLRTVQPIARWIPDRFMRHIPPLKVGSVEMTFPEKEAIGDVWVSPLASLEEQYLPKTLHRYDVLGIEGFPIAPQTRKANPVLTNGNALEFIVYLERFLFHFNRNGRKNKIKVAIGGSHPVQVSTVARLLGREVDEMVLIGEEPYLQRLAGQILAETGLAVRICPRLPNERFERVIECGGRKLRETSGDLLFAWDTPPAQRLHFPWISQGSSESAVQEIQSFAAAEVILMMLGGWDPSRIIPGILSVAWVEHIGKLRRETGIQLPLEELDTPPPVGYNVNNL